MLHILADVKSMRKLENDTIMVSKCLKSISKYNLFLFLEKKNTHIIFNILLIYQTPKIAILNFDCYLIRNDIKINPYSLWCI